MDGVVGGVTSTMMGGAVTRTYGKRINMIKKTGKTILLKNQTLELNLRKPKVLTFSRKGYDNVDRKGKCALENACV